MSSVFNGLKSKLRELPCTADDLPIEAYMGTIYAVSPLGTVFRVYTYIDPDVRPWIWRNETVPTRRTYADFLHLARMDRIFFPCQTDHAIGSLERYHRQLRDLITNGEFTLYTLA